MDTAEIVGFVAGLFTTASYVPQVGKCWKHKSGENLSVRWLATLSLGLLLWLGYGVMQKSTPIVLFNAISLCLTLGLMAMKFVFDRRSRRSAGRQPASKAA